MATSSRKSRNSVLPLASAFNRSGSPSDRFGSRSSALAADMPSPFASSTSSSFCSSPSSSYVYGRPSSPTRVNLHGRAPMTSSSVRVSITSRSGSPNRSMAVVPRNQVVRNQNGGSSQKRCLCSPTTHPGSFRCSLHKNYNSSHSMPSYSPNRLNARRSAMTNSLVRIATAEGGDLVKRALAALIRPSSHQQRRRSAFEPRPSRLSIMSKADASDSKALSSLSVTSVRAPLSHVQRRASDMVTVLLDNGVVPLYVKKIPSTRSYGGVFVQGE